MEPEVSSGTWIKSGGAFVISTIRSSESSTAMFFTAHGDLIRELDLQGKGIYAVSLDPTDTTLTIAWDNLFCLAQIVPSILWAFTMNTLLYAYEKNNDSVFTAVFFN
jgi:WD repeat-containing protein 35